MILFTILLATLVLLVLVVVFAVSIGGSIFIILFGDVIVCITFIILIMRHLIKKIRKK